MSQHSPTTPILASFWDSFAPMEDMVHCFLFIPSSARGRMWGTVAGYHLQLSPFWSTRHWGSSAVGRESSVGNFAHSAFWDLRSEHCWSFRMPIQHCQHHPRPTGWEEPHRMGTKLNWTWTEPNLIVEPWSRMSKVRRISLPLVVELPLLHLFFQWSQPSAVLMYTPILF